MPPSGGTEVGCCARIPRAWQAQQGAASGQRGGDSAPRRRRWRDGCAAGRLNRRCRQRASRPERLRAGGGTCGCGCARIGTWQWSGASGERGQLPGCGGQLPHLHPAPHARFGRGQLEWLRTTHSGKPGTASAEFSVTHISVYAARCLWQRRATRSSCSSTALPPLLGVARQQQRLRLSHLADTGPDTDGPPSSVPMQHWSRPLDRGALRAARRRRWLGFNTAGCMAALLTGASAALPGSGSRVGSHE